MSKSWVGLTIVILLVIAIRLIFAFQTPFYSSDSAYLHIRAVESLQQGKLLWHDPLGYGGRTLVASPIFDAILAIFGLIMPLQLALKIIPNILASLIIIPAYLIAHKLTKDRTISLVTAFLVSIVPTFFSHTFNHVTPLTLALPIFFFLTYAWLQIPEYKWVMAFLATLLVFVFLHPLSIIFVLSIGLYIALGWLERLKILMAEYEYE